jgi:hypothetical protein
MLGPEPDDQWADEEEEEVHVGIVASGIALTALAGVPQPTLNPVRT